MLSYSLFYAQKAAHDLIPLKVSITLTEQCSESCLHCYIPNGPRRAGLPESRVVALLSELADAGCVVLTLTGGEPLLRPDLRRIMSTACELNFAVGLFTNGVLVDASFADFAAGLPLQTIEISLYGPSAEAHERMTRRPGSFDESLRGSRLLVERGVHVVHKYVLTEQTGAHTGEMRELSGSLGCDWSFDHRILPRIDGDDTPLGLGMAEDQLAQHFAGDPPPESATRDVIIGLDLACVGGHAQASVTAGGEVIPCIMFPESWSLGNVAETDFGSLWHAERATEIRRRFAGRLGPECGACSDEAWCHRCPAVSLALCGDLRKLYPTACVAARLIHQLRPDPASACVVHTR
ncbi:MAG: radical SAM protein [Armatimonadetes bacterium]|nr:radical SAM protein [Armatimonadota bacterium]